MPIRVADHIICHAHNAGIQQPKKSHQPSFGYCTHDACSILQRLRHKVSWSTLVISFWNLAMYAMSSSSGRVEWSIACVSCVLSCVQPKVAKRDTESTDEQAMFSRQPDADQRGSFTRSRALRRIAILLLLLSSCLRASSSVSLSETRLASAMTSSGRSARRARSKPVQTVSIPAWSIDEMGTIMLESLCGTVNNSAS